MNILMLGPPGAGKGTYSKRLSQKINFPIFGTGDIIREEIKQKTDFGKKVEKIVNSGGLINDDLVVELIERKILEHESENKDGYILDGFPRTVHQAEALEEFTEINIVINLIVPEKIILERLTGRRVCPNCKAVYHLKNLPSKKEGICDVCGTKLIHRNDDKEEAIKNRLKTYDEKTKPLIEFFKEKGILCGINGDQPVEDAMKDIYVALDIN